MVDGIDKLKARFDKLGKKLLVAAHPAMLEGGDNIVATARLLVPVDEGHLRSTIRRSEILKTRKKQNDMVEVSAGDETTLVGTTKQFNLARIIEWGTQSRTAEPYMRPALRRWKGPIRSKIRKALTAAIQDSNNGH